MMQFSLSRHPTGALLELDLWSRQTSSVQRIHCQGTSQRWYELYWCVILPKAAIKERVYCGYKGISMVSNNTQAGCAI